MRSIVREIVSPSTIAEALCLAIFLTCAFVYAALGCGA